MKNSALTVAGIIFTVVAIVHIARFVKGWTVVFAQFTIPLQWSIYGAIIAFTLAVWMFVAASKN